MREYLRYRLPLLTLAAGWLAGTAGLASSATAQVSPTEESRLFAVDSFWNQPLASEAPLDPSSDLLVASLREEVQQDLDTNTGPWINTGSYSTPLYRVPADQPTVPVKLDSTSNAPWRHALQAAFEQVPIPPTAEPAGGTDGHMTVWQPSTDRMWEFWKASRQADGWHARWGGATDNVSENPGYYTVDAWPGASHHWGATATGLPVIGGVMLLDEFEAGEVDHALALNIPRPRAREYSWPAQGTDGTEDNPALIPEGARFRIDPGLDLSSLAMHPVTRMMAEAAQRYGIVVRDRSGSAVSFSAEDFGEGINPYRVPDGGYFRNRAPNQFLAEFPWGHVQLLEMSLCSNESAPCAPPDLTAPTIEEVSPGAGATAVTPSTNVVISFSEPMDRQATEAAFALTQSGLQFSGSFSWNSAGTELTFDPSSPLVTGSYSASVSTSATDEAGNALAAYPPWGFTVEATPAPTVSAPGATVILTGSYRGGNAASLSADDNAFYSVNSTTGTTRTTSWYGRFDGVPSSVPRLEVTYSGSNSRTCSQTIAIRRFTTSSWVTLDSHSVGTSEIKFSGLTPPGTPASYVNGTGKVQVRVLCRTTAGTFHSRGDLLELKR